jgi:DNA-binding response OmpR family regulator
MKKVYIVDDDQDIVEYISMILKQAGYETGCQHDDKDVVQNVKDYAPNAIILDVMFPEDESSGFKLARELRADKTVGTIPILMLSAINERGIYPGKFSDHDRDDSFLPVDAFVEKPISPDDLVAKIEKLTS